MQNPGDNGTGGLFRVKISPQNRFFSFHVIISFREQVPEASNDVSGAGFIPVSGSPRGPSLKSYLSRPPWGSLGSFYGLCECFSVH